MKNLELRVRKNSKVLGMWDIEVYNPNIASKEKEFSRFFTTEGEAYCWADTVGDVYEVLGNGSIIRATTNKDLIENSPLMSEGVMRWKDK